MSNSKISSRRNKSDGMLAEARRQQQRILSTSDFLFGATIGEGAYARVVHARLKSRKGSSFSSNKVDYCIKIMEKRHIVKEGKVKHVMKEKNLLSSLDSDLIVKLYGSFHDRENLYLVLDFCTGGELAHMIQQFRENRREGSICCSLECVHYYSGNILRALEYLHSRGVIHRDLKPENILLTAQGTIKLADFGAALDTRNLAGGTSARTNSTSFSDQSVIRRFSRQDSFVGTAGYVSPEVLIGHEVTPSVDLWALGCIIFQMLVGKSPFFAPNDFLIIQSVMQHAKKSHPLKFPSFISDQAKDLISGSLVLDPMERIGYKDFCRNDDNFMYTSIRQHAFFENFCWDHLDDNMLNPPYIPPLPELLRRTKSGEILMRDGAEGINDWILDGVATLIS